MNTEPKGAWEWGKHVHGYKSCLYKWYQLIFCDNLASYIQHKMSSYTLNGRRTGAMQLHTRGGFSPEMSCQTRELYMTTGRCLEHRSGTFRTPCFYKDIVQESTELFTLFPPVEKTTGYTGGWFSPQFSMDDLWVHVVVACRAQAPEVSPLFLFSPPPSLSSMTTTSRENRLTTPGDLNSTSSEWVGPEW